MLPAEQAAGGAGGLLGDVPATPSGLPFVKPEDYQYFAPLLKEGAADEEDGGHLTAEEAKERRIMRLLLRIKNGTPPMRKVALKQIADKRARLWRGAALQPDPAADDVADARGPGAPPPRQGDRPRPLQAGRAVRPYVHKILVVVEPLLIDEDYYARVEGREIIANLAKAAGLATMIAAMRPDIDNVDEYVRNTTARAFSVVASALGIPALLPFLRAVCRSKKSWQARHTGAKIVQQIAILMGPAVLPHLQGLVDIAGPALGDESQKVRTLGALALAALAEAGPFGIEAFDGGSSRCGAASGSTAARASPPSSRRSASSSR